MKLQRRRRCRAQEKNDINAAPRALQSTKYTRTVWEGRDGKGMRCGTPSFLRVVTACQSLRLPFRLRHESENVRSVHKTSENIRI
eukprot:gene16390-biopygen12804